MAQQTLQMKYDDKTGLKQESSAECIEQSSEFKIYLQIKQSVRHNNSS